MSEEEDTQWEYPVNGSEYQDLNFPVRNEYTEMMDPKLELRGLNDLEPFNDSSAPDGFNTDRLRPQSTEQQMQVSLAILEEISKSFHKQGNDVEAMKYAEKVMLLKRELYGDTPEVLKECENFVIRCNVLAMRFLKNENYVMSYSFLKRAEAVTDEINGYITDNELRMRLRAATLNNFGCFFRRRGKLYAALRYLEMAIDTENNCKSAENPAATHLNMCAILSQLGRHVAALKHAQRALEVIEQRLEEDPSRKKSKNERSMLAVAYHNMAVEYEFLMNYSAACEYYAKSSEIAEKYIGINHPTTIAIQNSYYQATLKMRKRRKKLSAKKRQLQKLKKIKKDVEEDEKGSVDTRKEVNSIDQLPPLNYDPFTTFNREDLEQRESLTRASSKSNTQIPHSEAQDCTLSSTDPLGRDNLQHLVDNDSGEEMIPKPPPKRSYPHSRLQPSDIHRMNGKSKDRKEFDPNKHNTKSNGERKIPRPPPARTGERARLSNEEIKASQKKKSISANTDKTTERRDKFSVVVRKQSEDRSSKISPRRKRENDVSKFKPAPPQTKTSSARKRQKNKLTGDEAALLIQKNFKRFKCMKEYRIAKAIRASYAYRERKEPIKDSSSSVTSQLLNRLISFGATLDNLHRRLSVDSDDSAPNSPRITSIGRVPRKYEKDLTSKYATKEEHDAAKLLQHCCRRFIARLKVNKLRNEVNQKIENEIEKEKHELSVQLPV